MMTVSVEILIAIGCVLFGFVIGRLSKARSHGVFLVDDSEDAEAKWTLRLFVDPDDLPSGKNAHFKVIHKTEGDV